MFREGFSEYSYLLILMKLCPRDWNYWLERNNMELY